MCQTVESGTAPTTIRQPRDYDSFTFIGYEMKTDSPQAIEILVLCLAVGVLFAVLIIFLNCAATCYHNCKKRKRKAAVERLPESYIDEIQRLLDRHKRVMGDYDCEKLECNEYDLPSSRLTSPQSQYADDSTKTTPTMRSPSSSRRNSVRLRRIKEELEPFKEMTEDEMEDLKRRTWEGGLCDSMFDPIPLPSTASDAECQTTATLDRMRPKKLETTV